MTPLRLALCLAALFFIGSAQEKTLRLSGHVRQDGGLHSLDVGDSITLRCFYDEAAVMIYWFKQPLGQSPKIISTFYKHDANGHFSKDLNDSSRFELEVGNGQNHLTMSDLHTSDSATYYCVGIDEQKFEFGDGARVSVRESATVLQSGSESAESAGSVTQNCTVQTGTCDGERCVYWFRNTEESDPGLFYTHGDRNEQCERNPDVQSHTCVYHLPMEALNGTRYCAVASCGRVLFGHRANLESADELNPPDFLVYLLSGALTVTTMLTVWMVVSVYKMNKRIQSLKESHLGNPESSTSNSEGYQDAENLHYAALRPKRFSRAGRQKDDVQCVYSSVRQ